jgi:amidophosphoribosyltransferase
MKISTAMILDVVDRPGDPFIAMRRLLTDNHEPRKRQLAHIREAVGIARSLLQAGVIERLEEPDGDPDQEGRRYRLTVDLPRDFALNQPLSTFALAAIEALDPVSETCALDMIGARFVRDIEHGEMVVIDHEGIHSLRPFPAAQARPCIFEYVYFARPDSVVNGKSIYEVRKRMGRRLAQETPADVDVVVPVPDSGVPAALGFAQEAGLPFEMGIIRNHYVGRTFIQPTQGARETGVRMKLSPNRAVLAGKKVMLIDDSIVRGTNSMRVVRMVREAGATEVHLRSASPPIQWPDFYGIDMPDRDKLLAAHNSVEDIARILNVDSMGFLSVEGLYWAMEAGPRNAANPQFTDHYFTGDYPTRLLDREIAEGRNAVTDRQLSFLVDA